MKKLWKRVRVPAASFLIVYYVLVWLGAMPKTAQLCTQDPNQKYPDCSAYDVVSYIILRATQIADAHNGLITALATIVIGIFTYTLWRTNVWLERPFVLIEALHAKQREGEKLPENPNSWWVRFKWRNVGRSPAYIEECRVGLIDKDLLPKIPDYENCPIQSAQQTVRPDKFFWTREIGAGEPIRMKDGKPVNFVVYGRLLYTDLMGNPHKTGFAVEMSPHMPVGSTLNNDAYNYYD